VFTLHLLGTPRLDGPDGPLPATGPRRLALLAIVAVAGPAGITRDKVLALLWPESDEDRARRNLSQALYAMRTELGADLIEGTGTLRLAPTCRCDVVAFDEAAAAGRHGNALAAYGGPLLDGFHLTDSREFSAWLEEERAHRERRARELAEAAAKHAAEAGASKAAIAAWHRAAELDPLNERIVVALMDALVAGGDRAAALTQGDRYVARLRMELEADPGPAVVERLARWRRPADPVVPPPAPTPPVAVPTRPPAEASPPAPLAAAAPAPPAAPSGRRGGRGVATVIGLAVLAGIAAVATRDPRPPAALRANEYVVLAEFGNASGDSLLSSTVSAGFAAALEQSAHVQLLPRTQVAYVLARMQQPDTAARLAAPLAREVAQRSGVRMVIDGEVIGRGAARELIVRVVEAASGQPLATHRAPIPDDAAVLGAIDALAAAVRRDLGDAQERIAERQPLPDVTTPSLPALYAYVAGQAAFRRGDGVSAARLWREAVALDSGFAAAVAALGANAAYNNDLEAADRYFARARALAVRLPAPEAMLIRASAEWWRGSRDLAISETRSYLQLRPRDAAAWSRLAYYLLEENRVGEARDAWAAAEALAPLNAGDLLNVGTAWMRDARTRRARAAFDSARAYYARAFAEQPSLATSGYLNHQYGTILVATGDLDSARAVFERMLTRSPTDRARGLRSLAFLDAWEGDWATAMARLGDAATLYDAQGETTSWLRTIALRAQLAQLVGDAATARGLVARGAAAASGRTIDVRVIRWLAVVAARTGQPEVAARLEARMRAALRAPRIDERAAVLHVAGERLLATGRVAGALDSLRAAAALDSTVQVALAIATVRQAAGDAAGAIGDLQRIGEQFAFGFEGQFEWQLLDAALGEALETTAQPEAAVAAYRRLADRFPPDGTHAVPLAVQRARRRLELLQR
jgi:DNA-binding SARP family transcriptional activator/tetratricopeptide (TPR) repeat protein